MESIRSSSSSSIVFYPAVVANSVIDRINGLMKELRIEFAQMNPKNGLLMRSMSISLLKEAVSTTCALQDLINECQNEEPIPTLSLFKKENQKVADSYSTLIESFVRQEEYAEALKCYAHLFVHRKDLWNFSDMALLYERAGELKKAIYTFIRLALYYIEEHETINAIIALQHSKMCNEKVSVDRSIDRIILFLKMARDNTLKQIIEAMNQAATETDIEEKKAIYKWVIAYNPTMLEAYDRLLSLLKPTDDEFRFYYFEHTKVKNLAHDLLKN